jgi:hypothetical protein
VFVRFVGRTLRDLSLFVTRLGRVLGAWCSLPFAVAAHLEPEILIVDDSGLLAGWAETPFMFEPTGEIA